MGDCVMGEFVMGEFVMGLCVTGDFVPGSKFSTKRTLFFEFVSFLFEVHLQ
jgi:hypothetical protein